MAEIDLDNYGFLADVEATQEMNMPDEPGEISWGSVNVDRTVSITIWDKRAPRGETWLVDDVNVRDDDDEEIHRKCVEAIRRYEERRANG